MRYGWNLRAVNEPAKGIVGIAVTLTRDDLVLQELLTPDNAREISATLDKLADELAPTPETVIEGR